MDDSAAAHEGLDEIEKDGADGRYDKAGAAILCAESESREERFDSTGLLFSMGEYAGNVARVSCLTETSELTDDELAE